MRYYSDKTRKFYDSEKECAEAEDQYQKDLIEHEEAAKKKSDERAARAKEVEDAYKAATEATKHYQELLSKFVKDYQSYHMTIRYPHDLIGDIFTSFFDLI